MVAKIKSGKSLMGALSYNENKVKQGKAELLEVRGYLKDAAFLNFHEKLFRLKDLAERNQQVKTNTVHISLNFDVKENLPGETLINIVDAYMDKLGFGCQPYLIYRHTDAGHPHVHIVTTNIEATGNRISLHNIGKYLSEPARKEIEISYGLVKAESRKKLELTPGKIFPVIYGAADTKRAISNIIGAVANAYKFTSLAEFNAVLKFFNVQADRGSKESTMYKNNGLRYWILDAKGQKKGVPLKASNIYGKPTLTLLENRFKLSEFLRKTSRVQLKNKIDRGLSISTSRHQFENALNKLNVDVIFRENEQGRLYGITYIDHESKTVFNGSDIGKNYGAAALPPHIGKLAENESLNADLSFSYKQPHLVTEQTSSTVSHHRSLLEDMLAGAEMGSQIPNELTRKKRKKRKKITL